MLECVAFYDCIDFFFFFVAFSTSDLGETAKKEGLGNQIYLTGKQLKSSAVDQPLVQGFKKGGGGDSQMPMKHTLEKCHLLDLSDHTGFEK